MPSNSWLAAFLSFCFYVEKAQATSELIPLIPPAAISFLPAPNSLASWICSEILFLFFSSSYISFSGFEYGLGLRDFCLHAPFAILELVPIRQSDWCQQFRCVSPLQLDKEAPCMF